MTNIKSKINPYSKIYNNFNKFITSLSCVCFIIAIIIPGGEHMNILSNYNDNIIFASFSDQYLHFNNKLYLLFEKIDHIAILNLACSFLNIDIYMFLILCIFSLKRKIKDVILIILLEQYFIVYMIKINIYLHIFLL